MITYRWPQEGGMRRRRRRWRGSWWRLRRAKKLKVAKSATKVVGRRRWTELVAARSCTGTLPPRHPAVVLSSPGSTSVSSTKLSFVIFLKTNLVGSWSKTARPLFVRFFCVLFCANFKQFWIFWDRGKIQQVYFTNWGRLLYNKPSISVHNHNRNSFNYIDTLL